MSACEEVRPLLGRYVDGELEAADISRVDDHVSACESCAAELRLMQREAELLCAAFAPEEEAPEQLCANLWESLQESPARPRSTPMRRAALAAAAVIIIGWFVALVVTNTQPGAELARVTACAGPLEISHPSRGWVPLGTYIMLRDGARIRCGSRNAGTLIVGADNRFDLDAGTEIALALDGSSFRIALKRGRIHAALPSLTQSFNILTPVADVVVTVEDPETAGPMELEIALTGLEPEPELSWLDSIHILPAAHATVDGPQLELLVYEGSAHVNNASGDTAVVTSGRRIVVGKGAPIPESTAFDIGARRTWWPSNLRAAIVRRSAQLPAPAEPAERDPGSPTSETGAESGTAGQPERVPESGGPVEPAPVPVEGPPAPEGLVAVADIDAVLLTWKPIVDSKRRIVEYGIYRRAPGDTEFALIGRFPVIGSDIKEYVFRDAGVGMGTKYQYAVAAAWRGDAGDDLVEGKLSNVATGSAVDFRIYYAGGKKKGLAIIVIEKLHDGTMRRQTFMVRKRDPATDETGEIGETRQVVIEPVRGAGHRVLIDFSTGYRLIDIITVVEEKDGIPRERSSIIIENALGARKTITRHGARP